MLCPDDNRYEYFRLDRFWWSSVIFVRRVVLITLTAQLSVVRSTMFSWVSVANIVFLLIHMLFR
jgi:hypothetical protein